MAAVWFDVAGVEPPAFVAVTFTRIVDPTSAAWSVYVELVAPPMSPQFAPAESQRCHWYAKLVGLPDHVPFDVDSC